MGNMDYRAEKERAYAYLDAIADRIYGDADTVRGTPELGFREEKTSAFVEERMRALGLYNVRRVALTGVAAELFPPRDGEERVCVIGELDAVLTPDCPLCRSPYRGGTYLRTLHSDCRTARRCGCAEEQRRCGRIGRKCDVPCRSG